MNDFNKGLGSNKVVTKALINLKQEFNITNECLANILEIEAEAAGELNSDSNPINDGQRESALMLIRVYRSLYGILGGDPTAIKHWLNTDNALLNGIPIELIQTPESLYKTIHYLEATQELSMDASYDDFVRCPNCSTRIEFEYGLPAECGQCGLEIIVEEGDVHQCHNIHVLNDEF